MKPLDVKPNIYIEFNKENNRKGSKYIVGDHVTISKYKKSFAKIYVPNWSEKLFVIKKVKNTVSWTKFICDFDGEVIAGIFYQKELQKINQKEFRIEKVIRKKVIDYMLNETVIIIHLTDE